MSKDIEKKPVKLASILVCGSSNFTDPNFVYSLLSMMNIQLKDSNAKIGYIYTSNFSGASQYARIWADMENERNIGTEGYNRIVIKEHVFDLHLEEKNHTFFEEAVIPGPVLKNDQFFKKGQEELTNLKINMVMAFPNNTGKLGASTINIKRFADLAKVPFLNCADAYKMLLAKQKQALEEEVAKRQNRENVRVQIVDNEEPTIKMAPSLINRRRQR